MELITGENISILIFFVGFSGLMLKRNVIKSIICIGIMQAAIIIFFLSSGLSPDNVPPIDATGLQNVADPLPQALMITDIVIGIGVTAMALSLFIHMYHQFGTADWEKAFKLRKDSEE